MNVLDGMTVDLPEIDEAGVRVEKFTVSESDARFSAMRAVFQGRGYVPPWTYTRLSVDGTLWMSDTPDEKRDHIAPVWEASRRGGRILVNGLGLGMVVSGLLKLPNVEHVDVVEKSERIVDLIGPHYESSRCTVHHSDAYTIKWPAGTRWTVAWHDVWAYLSLDNIEGMHRLHRRYGRRVDWQGSWGREFVEARR